MTVFIRVEALDANPLNRPTAKEVQVVLYRWVLLVPEILKQIEEAEEIYQLTPKNSDDYYDEQNDNMIQNLYKSIFLNWQLKIMQIKDYSTY
ncbi:hypothetical protein RhiirA5_421375 [Rhizophagus irregularis]|uniref:Uncharacterized protein n=1 Tax=Rhizophagus irregularis TaxID=588596 RepID=A0A2N0PE39_9GLOM|nr:hypothetical protein RhiirA5_421375 [Rhizophagus irregularis]